ncbi:sodium channel subunit beta-2-like [Lethenteron reissneri]|uniref:sodium channel subunit beta-2-like n=1 Tax=Lethenteron reissneri TaxID=7753 RepID=UPI002AB7B3FA|nr:sodium channel subunit beta-2-like [Lethenteron reissneri]
MLSKNQSHSHSFSGAVSEGDGSLQCSNFSYRTSICTERFVMGMAGSSALLPCTFSLNSLSNQVHVEWRLQEVNKGLLIFNSSNNYIEGKFQDRLRLVGDPTKGEASINITNLNCSDTNAYFCHIKELKMNQEGNREYNYADQLGTLLVVDDVSMEDNVTTASNSTSSITVIVISIGSISLGAVIACVVQRALQARALKRSSLTMVVRETPITYDAVRVERVTGTSEDRNNFRTYSNVIYSTVSH